METTLHERSYEKARGLNFGYDLSLGAGRGIDQSQGLMVSRDSAQAPTVRRGPVPRPESSRSMTSTEGYALRTAGVIRANKMTFTVDGNRFEWVSTKPVMSGRWDLWVLHEPDYPAPPSGWRFLATGLENHSAKP